MPDFTDNDHFMNRSTVLRRHGSGRAHFDPTNEAHVESMRTFVSTGNWGKQQFYPEAPFTDVPTTVLMKYAAHREGIQSRIFPEYEPA